MNNTIKILTAITGMICLSTSTYAFNFTAVNDLQTSNDISYDIHAGPNGDAPDVTNSSNLATNAWHASENFIGEGQDLNYWLNGNINYSQPTINIDIYNSENQLITSCPITNITKNGISKISDSSKIQPCDNPNFYAESDLGNPNVVYIHNGPYNTKTFKVKNDLSSSYYIHLGPNGGSSDITMQSNPDNDSWSLDGAYAANGSDAAYSISSPDGFNNYQPNVYVSKKYSSFNVDSEANIVIDIYNKSTNQLVTSCPVSGVYFEGKDDTVAISNDTQPCGNTNFYVQDDRGSASGHGYELFVHQS